MQNRICSEKVAFVFVSLYPLFNISISYLFNKQGLRSAYIIFSIIILFFLELKHRMFSAAVNRKFIILTVIALCSVILSCYNNPSTDAFLNGIVFMIFILFMQAYSDRKIIERFDEYCNKNTRFINSIICLYLLVLVLSCVFGDGINIEGWNTTSIRGPYEINHLLAYELLVFVAFSIKISFLKRSLPQFILTLLLISLVFFTGVRSALLALVILSIVYFRKLKVKTLVVVVFVGLFAAYFLFSNTGIFNAVLQKTKTTIEMGSISSSRPLIFKSSIMAYFYSGNSLMDFLFGIGLDRLTSFNKREIFMSIHAHNDFIDALVIFGVFGLLLYLYGIINFFSKNKSKMLFLFFFILAFFNGFYQYQFVVIGMPFLITSFNDYQKQFC